MYNDTSTMCLEIRKMAKLVPEISTSMMNEADNTRYTADLDYSHAMVIFMCVTIAFFAAVKLLSRITNTRIRRSPFGKRILGSYRYLSYRSYYLRTFDWYSPSLGVILIGVIGSVFTMTLLLAVKPYYWPNTKGAHALSFGSSPPIATRAGWMSLSLLPFIMALSAKQNLITFLTGVSHEKLQVFHQWTAYAMLILALVHTFPFVVYHIWLGFVSNPSIFKIRRN
jgi:hypothetical protein